MRSLIILFFTINVMYCTAQKAGKLKANNGYGYFSVGAFLTQNNGTMFYPSVGLGFKSKRASLGVAFYYTKLYNMSLHGDMRVLLSENPKTTPFISFQPGILLYSKDIKIGQIRTTETGGLALNILFGIMGKGKKGGPGPYLSMGYGLQTINTRVNNKSASYKNKGGVVSIGIKI